MWLRILRKSALLLRVSFARRSYVRHLFASRIALLFCSVCSVCFKSPPAFADPAQRRSSEER